MKGGPEECVIISDVESNTSETFTHIFNNTTTDTRRNNAEAENLNSVSLTEEKRSVRQQSDEVFLTEAVTAYSSIKKQLRPRFSKTCQACGKQFKSLSSKTKHISVSERCRNSTKNIQKISCLFCKTEFVSEERKTEHLRISLSCLEFLKDHFHQGKFLDSTQICNNFSLNTFMCPFCLFRADDGDVFSHVLSALKCRKNLEGAVKNQMYPSSTVVNKTERPQQLLCKICNIPFKSLWHLRYHRKKTHRKVARYKQQKRRNDANDVYCFICKINLKSQAEMECHPCRPIRLLSRTCYRKAVWKLNEYECQVCTKFFQGKSELEKHMYHHDQKKSHLFQFVPCSSKQDAIPPIHSSGLTSGTAAQSSKLSCLTIGDRAGTSTNWNWNREARYMSCVSESSTTLKLYREAKDKSCVSEKRLKNKIDFTCEKCRKTFNLAYVFISHVLMKFPCLEHYENMGNNSPDNLCFCFKCKQKFRNNEACMKHTCIGLVKHFFQCALCSWTSPNIINLRKHENSKHKRNMHSSTPDDKRALSAAKSNDNETPDYHCGICQATFINLNEFVKHISNSEAHI